MMVNALHWASVSLGALYALTLVVNIFNGAIALRWPRLAAVLSTLGGHIADARAELKALEPVAEAAAKAGGAL